MITPRIRLFTLVWFIGLWLLAACMAQTPIPVYVTPTPQQADLASVTPIVDVASLPTSVAVIATEIPAPTTISGTVQPTVTFMGPVVQPGYTLPPTATPPATNTPQPSHTPTLGPSQTPVPTLTPGGPTPTPLPGLDALRMGVQIHADLEQRDWDDAMFRAELLQVNWIKVQVAWELIQPNGPTDFSTEFQRLELYLQDADERDFNILISVAKAPNWARDTLEEDGPPRDPQLLADFLTFFLARNNLGSRIDAIEVWNEPNLLREWRGRPLSGTEYMNYFEAAYAAIRAYSPGIVIVTAAPAPTGTSVGSVDDRAYLQQMYNAGLGNYQDIAIGFHPYSWGNPPDAHCCNAIDGENWDDDPHFFFSNTLEDYREMMVEYGHQAVQLWATEFGWATWAGFPGEPPEAWMSYNTPEDQANYTLRAFEIAQGLDYMGPMFLWNLNLADVNPELIEARDERVAYSLVLPEGNPQERPLYWMLYAAPRANVTPNPND